VYLSQEIGLWMANSTGIELLSNSETMSMSISGTSSIAYYICQELGYWISNPETKSQAD